MAKKWYAIFSHTGCEIKNIQKVLKRQPDGIITSNRHYDGELPAAYGSKEQIEEFMRGVEPGSVITLNGYRYLISAETLKVLEQRNVLLLNIHPAPVYLEGYEDLRGIDPHLRYYEGYQAGKYTCLGVTIHAVDEGIDTGRVVYGKHELIEPGMSYTLFNSKLHAMGTIAWCLCLPQLLGMEE